MFSDEIGMVQLNCFRSQSFSRVSGSVPLEGATLRTLESLRSLGSLGSLKLLRLLEPLRSFMSLEPLRPLGSLGSIGSQSEFDGVPVAL